MSRKSFCILFTTLFAIITLTITCGESKRDKISTVSPDTATVIIAPEDFNPSINVYIENSGSMDAYVAGQTEFESIVYNFLANIGIANVSDNLNLNYINSEILPQKDDIQDFIEKLEPKTFRAKGGKRGASDIASMINNIFKEMNDSTVSIFISDCIFSPGKGKDAEEYLNNQQIGVKRTLGEYFNKHPQLAVVGYRCLSSFDGKYYDKTDKPQQYKGKRPFYIWMFGTQGALNRMLYRLSSENLKISGVENEYVAFAAGEILPAENYAIKPNSGEFDLDKSDTKHSIKNLEKGHNGKVQFAVNVNFAHLLLGDSYLCDESMYRLNDAKIKLESVERINKESKYTHTLRFVMDRPRPTELEISLLAGTPKWPESYNDDKGEHLDENNEDKTFGLKYMVNGFTEAIVRKDYYTSFKININKQ